MIKTKFRPVVGGQSKKSDKATVIITEGNPESKQVAKKAILELADRGYCTQQTRNISNIHESSKRHTPNSSIFNSRRGLIQRQDVLLIGFGEFFDLIFFQYFFPRSLN